ncbi:sensor domain-containing diguanylate cyclase [Salirhabdus salicampi]|uniref:sensor domain-containing diguanylate cyclase n=1 Tax=Salirhabdus salicampi TaxID=476102 RepID=UPI0020C2008A|nr:diguanylate cyclase [Salirhabdus salicampi]MCP8617134.1 diguanylate cyclase [Salirhabdus salicampi]
MEKIKKQIKLSFYDIQFENRLSVQEMIERVVAKVQDILHAKTVGIYLLHDPMNSYLLQNAYSSETLLNIVHQMDWKSYKNEQMGKSDVLDGNCFCKSGTFDGESVVIPIQKEKYEALVFIGFEDRDQLQSYIQTFHMVATEIIKMIVHRKHFLNSDEEQNKFTNVANTMATFHSSLNRKNVLTTMMKTIKEKFPAVEAYLLLSQGQMEANQLPIKDIKYDQSPDQSETKAFLTGEIQYDIRNQRIHMFVPLIGTQGIYGVLEVISQETRFFTNQVIDFFTFLGNTAGSALEKASLYEKSQRKISNLQFINNTSQTLTSTMDITETFAYLHHLIQKDLHADEVGFFLQSDDGNLHFMEESSTYFKENIEQCKLLLNDERIKNGESIFTGEIKEAIPHCTPVPYESVMIVPMMEERNVIGYVIALHQEKYFFSLETYKLLQSIVRHSTLTVTNSMLKEELEYLVRTDYLTKLSSRKHLDEMMYEDVRQGMKGSFVIVDIDNFKAINDCYGHDVGDKVIIQVAQIIQDTIGSNDVAARWGGEELAIYLPNSSLEKSTIIADHLVNRVSHSTTPKVTISCGISSWNHTINNQLKDIFIRADRALYKAKKDGKNLVRTDNAL